MGGQIPDMSLNVENRGIQPRGDLFGFEVFIEPHRPSHGYIPMTTTPEAARA